MQAWSTCAHKPPQHPMLHRYKKPELETDPLRLRTFQISLSDYLLSWQSEWSCWYLILITLAECWERRHSPTREHQNPPSITIFVCSSLKVESFEIKTTLPPAIDSNLWNRCPTTTAPFLGLHSSWTGLESPYTANIGTMKMRLPKLQDNDKEPKKSRLEE